jgi:hypothetical protein
MGTRGVGELLALGINFGLHTYLYSAVDVDAVALLVFDNARPSKVDPEIIIRYQIPLDTRFKTHAKNRLQLLSFFLQT